MTRSIPQRRLLVFLITVLLLALPLIAMQFTKEVRWTGSDFLAMGSLVLIAGLLCEWILRMPLRLTYRIGILAGVLITLVMVWLELAVGVFGTSFAGS